MSNAIDIVDAMTVASPAEVIHWDEKKGEPEDLGATGLQTISRHQKAWRTQGSELKWLRLSLVESRTIQLFL